MARALARYCRQPGCPLIVQGGGYCPNHAPNRALGWNQDATRIRGTRLQQLRQSLFAQEPYCRLCHTQIATIRDHIVPLARGGTDTPSNIQPVCEDCHRAKTQREAQHGFGLLR